MFHRVYSIHVFRSGSSYLFWVSSAHLSFPEFQALIITEIHLNHYKVSPCVFNFSFFFRYLLFTGVLHEGSTWWFIKDLYSFLKGSSTFFSEELKLSSYCNPECIFVYYIIGGGIMSFLIIWVHVFMIHMLSRLGYFKSINLVIGAILGYISPKASPKDCCYLWCL